MVTTPVPNVRFVCRQCPPIGMLSIDNFYYLNHIFIHFSSSNKYELSMSSRTKTYYLSMLYSTNA